MRESRTILMDDSYSMDRKRLHGADGAAGIRDVAKLARVSTATVSRFLNRPETVSLHARGRIEAAVTATDYVRNAAARALSLRRSGTLGAIIPTIHNAIFAQGIEAAQKHLANRGYTLLFSTTEYEPRIEYEQARNMLEHGVDGLIFMGDNHSKALYELLSARRIPFVNAGVYDPTRPYSCVGFDNREAAFRATRHLLDLGHRELAMVAGVTRNNDRAARRVSGFRAALAERGLNPVGVLERHYDFAEARNALRELLRYTPSPTAILGGNDVLALGVLFEAQARRIAVPRRLSIIGFDDLPIVQHQLPPLTTMHVPTEQMWQRACDIVLAAVEGYTQPCHQEIEVSLVVRGSTCAPEKRTRRRQATRRR